MERNINKIRKRKTSDEKLGFNTPTSYPIQSPNSDTIAPSEVPSFFPSQDNTVASQWPSSANITNVPTGFNPKAPNKPDNAWRIVGGIMGLLVLVATAVGIRRYIIRRRVPVVDYSSLNSPPQSDSDIKSGIEFSLLNNDYSKLPLSEEEEDDAAKARELDEGMRQTKQKLVEDLKSIVEESTSSKSLNNLVTPLSPRSRALIKASNENKDDEQIESEDEFFSSQEVDNLVELGEAGRKTVSHFDLYNNPPNKIISQNSDYDEGLGTKIAKNNNTISTEIVPSKGTRPLALERLDQKKIRQIL
jgi:hypothetical protein